MTAFTRTICEDLCRRYWHIHGVTPESILSDAGDQWNVKARCEVALRLQVLHGFSPIRIAQELTPDEGEDDDWECERMPWPEDYAALHLSTASPLGRVA